MKVEIKSSYIKWLTKNTPEAKASKSKLSEKQIEEYINEVLQNHMDSWNKIDE